MEIEYACNNRKVSTFNPENHFGTLMSFQLDCYDVRDTPEILV